MKPLAALAMVAALATSSPALAQFGWGQPFDFSNLQHLSPAVTGDWRACTNNERRYSLEEVAAGCARLIESSSSAETRSSVYWWRATAYDRAGQTERAAADYQAALAEFDQWVRDDEDSADAHYYRGSMLISMREYDRALAELAIADHMQRRNPRTIATIGRVAFLRGDYATAITHYDLADRIGRMTTNAGSVSHNRCEARAAAGVELELARQICDRAVRDSEGYPPVLVSRGFFRFRQGDMEGALADFERALRRDPNSAAALYGRATVAARNGQQEAAAADLARSLEINPRMAEYYGNAGMRP